MGRLAGARGKHLPLSRLSQRAEQWHQSSLQQIYRERMLGKEAHAKVLRDFLLEVNAADEQDQSMDEENELTDLGDIA